MYLKNILTCFLPTSPESYAFIAQQWAHDAQEQSLESAKDVHRIPDQNGSSRSAARLQWPSDDTGPAETASVSDLSRAQHCAVWFFRRWAAAASGGS